MAPVVAALREGYRYFAAAWWPPASTRDVPAGGRAVRLRGGRRPRGHAAATRRWRADREADGEDRRLARSRSGPTWPWCRATRRRCWRPSLACFYRRIPDRPRRGRPANREHLVALPRGGQSPAGRHRSCRCTSHRPKPPRGPAAGGVSGDSIEVTGNTVIDALRMEIARQRSRRFCAVASTESSVLTPRPTTGRRTRSSSSPDIGARTSGTASNRSAKRSPLWPSRYPDHRFVYPVHLNPNVEEHVNRLLGGLSERAAHRAAGLSELRGPDGAMPPGADGLRRRAGGSALARQAGARDARHDRAARGGGGRDRDPDWSGCQLDRGPRHAAAHRRRGVSVHGHAPRIPTGTATRQSGSWSEFAASS